MFQRMMKMDDLKHDGTYLYLEQLYKKYAVDLVALRTAVKPFLARIQEKYGYFGAQSNDLEMEILYMRLRELGPKRVLEFSPCNGYSTFWILSALHDNGGVGHLESYDLVDNALMAPLPEHLRRRWTFTKGDVFASVTVSTIPRFDYFHIDSDHTYEFGEKYTQEFLVTHSHLYGQTWGNVHDVFPYSPQPQPEGVPVLRWLAGSPRAESFTVGMWANPELYAAIMRLRFSLLFLYHTLKENLVVFASNHIPIAATWWLYIAIH